MKGKREKIKKEGRKRSDYNKLAYRKIQRVMWRRMTGLLLQTGYSESKHADICWEIHNIKRDRYKKTGKRILGRENNNIITVIKFLKRS